MGKSYRSSSSGGFNFKKFCKGLKKDFGRNVTIVGGCYPAARLCIFALLGVTLLFSGIGIYSWIIILMLLLILRWV